MSKDKDTNKRTVTSLKNPVKYTPIVKGTYITKEPVAGKARVLPKKYSILGDDSIVVLKRADITYFPLIRQSKGVIIEEGTMAGHFSQMLREMNLPSIIGAKDATKIISENQDITIYPTQDNGMRNEGAAVGGNLELETKEVPLEAFPDTKTKIYTLCSFERRIKQLRHLPISGVGLIRSEFLNSFLFGIHPQAIVDYSRGTLKDKAAKKSIDEVFCGVYEGDSKDPKDFFIDKIAYAIASIAEHIPGKRINYRLNDLRSDDAKNFIGGSNYETAEGNPFLGWRGTTRLIEESYREALYLECEIIKKVVEKYNTDIHLITPFCRTVEDGQKLVDLIRGYGLSGQEIGTMVETPSNVVLGDEFADVFDFFLVGPMDLTLCTYMADRECASLARYCDIDNDGTRAMVKTFLKNISEHKKDVLIGEFEVFKGLEDYLKVAGDNRLHLVCLPDKIEENIYNVKQLEEKIGI